MNEALLKLAKKYEAKAEKISSLTAPDPKAAEFYRAAAASVLSLAIAGYTTIEF